ncbi:orotidine-5'-phosphate decarboxylase [Bacillus niameyensis]|uniref:orotidine-5'-phosphate decarboxylase n=1 Tax=Bacillus niameyensis TaxID=1522308 RepID=UPI0007802EE3|nr:orotidine-5'-phosphate decarboxylase [Bacillus niameyensis]
MLPKPIIALDFPGRTETETFLKQFHEESLFVKVGMELFYKEGPVLLELLKELGHEIFLDLKLHDIPNTVYSSMKILASLNVDLVNVHAAGGSEMMRVAREGLEEGTPSGKSRPKIIAVTQLTSTGEEQMRNEQLIHCGLKESVLHYAQLTHSSGLDGVVCSALEAGAIRDVTSSDFLRVTPGIRLSGDSVDDQKRVVTPRQASDIGSTHIVVGRSITKAKDPLGAYLKVKSEWEMES